MAKYKLAMIVDDDEMDRFIIRRTLEDHNFCNQTISATNTESALEYLKANEDNPEELPDIIFLDILMPKKDGFVFLDAFAKMSDNVHKDCKIILVSNSNSIDDLNRANKNAYVSKFLSKPLTKEMLEAINF